MALMSLFTCIKCVLAQPCICLAECMHVWVRVLADVFVSATSVIHYAPRVDLFMKHRHVLEVGQRLPLIMAPRSVHQFSYLVHSFLARGNICHSHTSHLHHSAPSLSYIIFLLATSEVQQPIVLMPKPQCSVLCLSFLCVLRLTS